MTPSPQHDGATTEAMKLGYQPEAVPVRGLAIFVALVAVSGVVLHVSLWWFMKTMEAHIETVDVPGSVAPDTAMTSKYPLQPSVGHDTQDDQDLANLRRQENELFAKLGWTVRPGARDADIPPDIVRKVMEQQRARMAAPHVPATTTGNPTNSILPTTAPASDIRSGSEGGPPQ